MKIDETLRVLEDVAAKKQIKVSYEALGGELGGGGLCKVKGEWRVIIDKRATPGERVAMLAESLARFPLDDVYLAPEVRELVEQAAKKRG
jgi:hypothetical protein